MATTFPARWPGECADCFSSFEEGDEIGYVENEICCQDCCSDDESMCFNVDGDQSTPRSTPLGSTISD